MFSFFLFYVTNRYIAVLEQEIRSKGFFAVQNVAGDTIASIRASTFSISREAIPMVFGLMGGALPGLTALYQISKKENFRPGEEHGSAKWGTKRDITPFIDTKNPDNNIILSQSESLRLDKHQVFEYDRNKNVVVIGGSGSGKTYSIVKPNLYQMHSSYIITDSKGALLEETRTAFEEAGYEIKIFDTVALNTSMHYNPLAYIHREEDIFRLVNVIMENTNGESPQKGSEDTFWDKAERLFLMAIIGFVYERCSQTEQNFASVCTLISSSATSEEDESQVNVVDIAFEDLKAENPHSFAVKQYDMFLLAAGKTKKSILISVAVRLAPFNLPMLSQMTEYDDLDFESIGTRKTAFYVVMSDTDNTYSFLVAMMLYQLFNELTAYADRQPGKALKIPVRLMLDEFANIGKIPNFQRLIATIRSRNIHALIILQSVNQLKSVYKEDTETIIDNCDSIVFLGGSATGTTEMVSKMIGKTTINNENTNVTKGERGSFSINSQILGRDLIDPAEVSRLNQNDCIVLVRGLPAFRSKKYDAAKHPYILQQQKKIEQSLKKK